MLATLAGETVTMKLLFSLAAVALWIIMRRLTNQ